MLKLMKINEQKVNPIKTPAFPPEKIKGYDLFPELYCNIYCCAKKKSGKTSVIFKIIKQCTDKDTEIYIFCSTHNKDNNWIEIKKWMEDQERNSHFYTSLVEDGVNMLELVISDLQSQVSEDEEKKEESEEEEKIINFHEDEDYLSFKIKKRKPKKVAPKLLFIFDDFSAELKDKNIVKLLKEHRHFKSKVIISSQYPYDLLPESRTQMDYWLLFAGHPEEKLEAIYKDCDLSIPFDLFNKMYKMATEKKYHFFYIDRNLEKFRQDFNQEFIFS